MEHISQSLFEGELIRLAPFDPERDAEIEVKWYGDTELLAKTEREAVRPPTLAGLKKRYVEDEKDKRSFSSAIRTIGEDRLVGRATLRHIDHALGNGLVERVLIGSTRDRNRGFGTEALHLLLRYIFDELNLSRIGADVYAFNPGALRWLERAGFSVEVRRREALYRAGRRWDIISVGLLRDEWAARRAQQLGDHHV